MNTIDDRISAALRARAESLTEDDLSPAAPPVRGRVPSDRARWTVPLLAAAVAGIAVVATITAVQASRSNHAGPVNPPAGSVQPSPTSGATTPVRSASPIPSQSPAGPAPSAGTGSPPLWGHKPSLSPMQPLPPTQSVPSQSVPSQSVPSQSTPSPTTALPQPFVLGYQPLWPFSSYAQAEQWRTAGGRSQPWHLDAGQTALNFTRSYLGFTELDQVVGTPTMSDAGAHVRVGYRNPSGQLSTAAVLHLVRYGYDVDSPWEVVGSDDTTLTLEQPVYGSRVSSPMTIGGHITGVDENIVVSVLASQTDRATLARIPAGGDRSPWTTGPVAFGQRGVLTIVASTGGHVQQVERFAIQGVYTRAR
jgi:hypothetical protein